MIQKKNAMNDELIAIGYDATHIGQDRTGLASYGRTLLNGIAAIGRFELRVYGQSKSMQPMQSQLIRRENLLCAPWHTALEGTPWADRSKVKQLSADGVRLFHSLDGQLPRRLDQADIRIVVTVHDLIAMAHPEFYTPSEAKQFARRIQRVMAGADSIVASSECTKRDICQLADIDTRKVHVIYQSCSPRFTEEPTPSKMWQVRDKYVLPDRYILHVGKLDERKNVLQAVRALHYLPDDVSLVIVGRQTPYSDQLHDYVLQNRMHSRVQMLHNVPNDDLPPLYRMADCFVYPSRYEGFALPIVEAVSQGLPVVACTGSSLEETGGPDNLYVAPDDEKALAHAITEVLFGAPGRQQRIERSRRYISRFETADMIQSYANLYQEILNA